MLNFIYRITRSSVDPTALSLTIRGLLTYTIPFVIFATGLEPDVVQSIADMFIKAVFDLATLFATAQVLWGLIRKAYLLRWNHPDSGV